ncbi:hypothetical protein ACXR0O_24990 [Verrucomicrobiota bacterium sgz303538]
MIRKEGGVSVNAENHNEPGGSPDVSSCSFDSDISGDPVVLSQEDQQFLQEHEGTIEKGRQTFLDVARALAAIEDYKDGILYRQKYGSFQTYCEKRWGVSRQHVYRMKDAARQLDILSPRGDIAEDIKSSLAERHLRELNKIQDPEAKAAVLKNAIEKAGGGVPTVKQLQQEVRMHLNKGNTSTIGSKPPEPSIADEESETEEPSTPERREPMLEESSAGSEDAGVSTGSENTTAFHLADGAQMTVSVWSESTPCGQRLCSRLRKLEERVTQSAKASYVREVASQQRKLLSTAAWVYSQLGSSPSRKERERMACALSSVIDILQDEDCRPASRKLLEVHPELPFDQALNDSTTPVREDDPKSLPERRLTE